MSSWSLDGNWQWSPTLAAARWNFFQDHLHHSRSEHLLCQETFKNTNFKNMFWLILPDSVAWLSSKTTTDWSLESLLGPWPQGELQPEPRHTKWWIQVMFFGGQTLLLRICNTSGCQISHWFVISHDLTHGYKRSQKTATEMNFELIMLGVYFCHFFEGSNVLNRWHCLNWGPLPPRLDWFKL